MECKKDVPVGTKVRMVNCLEAGDNSGKIWTTASEPWELCGSWVVLLDGYRGGFSIKNLEVVK